MSDKLQSWTHGGCLQDEKARKGLGECIEMYFFGVGSIGGRPGKI